MDDDSYEFMFKIVLVGDSSVGKTNIMGKYLKNEFHEDSKSTVGVEFGSKEFVIENHTVRVQIWDTAGQERYKAITSAYYKGAKGAFVVYDITRKGTFESVDKWVSDLKATADKKITLLLIGNKCDLEDQRQISKDQAEQKAKSFDIAYLETSALSGENLEKAFEMLVNEVYKKCHLDMEDEEDRDMVPGKDVDLNKNNNQEKQKSCCEN